MEFTRVTIFYILLVVHVALLVLCGATHIVYFLGANLCVEAGRSVVLLPPVQWIALAMLLVAFDFAQATVLFRVFQNASGK